MTSEADLAAKELQDKVDQEIVEKLSDQKALEKYAFELFDTLDDVELKDRSIDFFTNKYEGEVKVKYKRATENHQFLVDNLSDEHGYLKNQCFQRLKATFVQLGEKMKWGNQNPNKKFPKKFVRDEVERNYVEMDFETIEDLPVDNCVQCAEAKTDEIVLCDVCDKWMHLSCAGVTTDIYDFAWHCTECDPKGIMKKCFDRFMVERKGRESAQLEVSKMVAEMDRVQGACTQLIDIAVACEGIDKGDKTVACEGTGDGEKTVACEGIANGVNSVACEGIDMLQTGGASTKDVDEIFAKRISDDSTKDVNEGLTKLRLLHGDVLKCVNQLGVGLDSKRGILKSSEPTGDGALKVASRDLNRTDSKFNGVSGEGTQHVVMNKLVTMINRQTIQKLPVFEGDVKEWAFFQAVYRSTTEQGGYNENENVIRLREALKGKAKNLVRDKLMFSTDAESIMEELKQAYGVPARLVVEYMNDLLKIKNLERVNDPRLPNFAAKMKDFVAVCKSIKREDDLKNEYSLSLLSVKLGSTSYYREWAKKKLANDLLNLEDFAAFLQSKVKEMPPVFGSSVNEKEKETKKSRFMMHNGNEEKSKKSDWKCIKCSGSHAIYMCDEFKGMSVPERWDLVRQKNLCAACLWSGHQMRDCKRSRICNVSGCVRRHNRLLHDGEKFKATNETSNQGDKQHAVCHHVDGNKGILRNELAGKRVQRTVALGKKLSEVDNGLSKVLFKILPVKVHGKDNMEVETFAMLDDGSSVTLVDKSIEKELGLQGKPVTLNLQWTKGITRKEDSKLIEIEISGVKMDTKHILKNVYAVDNLQLPTQTVDFKKLKGNFEHLRNLPLVNQINVTPKILIGLDHAKFLCNEEIRNGRDGDPVAVKTKLGWVVFGRTSPSMKVHHVEHHSETIKRVAEKQGDEDLHKLVKDYFSTENFGVGPPKRDLIGEDEKRALEVMNKTLKKVDGRFEIGLLWKKDNIKLPDSYPMAMKRLISLERSLKKKPELLEWKNNHMKSLLEKGYARIASKEELEKDWPRIWYAPTFVTFNENKIPPKPRDVADVAAQVDGISLNTNLLKGPDNMASLFAGLFKFREKAIAVNADVKEMFHQVRIIEEDQQCQRILWRDGDETKEPTVYIFQAMMFGPTCSPACAQFVKNHQAKLYQEKYPEASEALIKSTYVDDYFNSHDTVEKAFEVISNAIEICADMKFDLVGVQSNSNELLSMLPKHNVKQSMVSMDPAESESYMTKVLGMFWRTLPDKFTYVFFENELISRMLEPEFRPTKREVLKILMKFYDPLGLLSNYLIQGKLILQEIWREGTGWDEEIPEVLNWKWMEFLNQLRNIEKLEIPRHYAGSMSTNAKIELIVFVDASEEAYAATAYFRYQNEAEVKVAQVMAKAKVAPIKQLTVPQLELQAAILGVRLSQTIKENHTLKIERTTFLTDSKVVLAWINSKKYKFKPFVAVRVGEILDVSSRNEWYHVPTHENVADDATRSRSIEIGDNYTRWLSGPEFLRQPMDEWPIKRYSNNEEDELCRGTLLVIQEATDAEKVDDILDEIKPRFKAKWDSLVRVTAFILRAKEKFKKQGDNSLEFITPKEFEKAENYIFRKIQKETFSSELKDLDNKRNVQPNSNIFCLSPIMGEDGVIRMSSRAQKANISYAARNPAILPNKHDLVDLMIKHYHEKNQHMSEETIIADIREKAWILKIRVAVRRVGKDCQMCKIKKAKPIMPMMGQLPEARMDFGSKPFNHVGIDCFGPLNVRQGRATAKRYGIIFTCLTYRAVHLELLADMSLDQVMMAIRSLFARRGKAKFFYSDNGTNLVGADNQLKKDVKESIAILGKTVASKFSVEWKFIPAYSPWMGGAWERLIKSVKRSIDFTLNGETPKEETLRSALVEAEFLMNRRPLTHAPIDHEDAKPLTPNTALFGDDDDGALAPGEFEENDKYSAMSYRRAQHLANKYMERWIKEYLPEITRRTKWHKATKPIEVGDVVILIEPNETKYAWKKGRIVKVYPGPDGVVRTADVRLADKSLKMKRSAGRLAVLDVKKEFSAN